VSWCGGAGQDEDGLTERDAEEECDCSPERIRGDCDAEECVTEGREEEESAEVADRAECCIIEEEDDEGRMADEADEGTEAEENGESTVS